MPNNMMTTDTSFPHVEHDEDVNVSIEKIMDYLFMMREQLNYTLSNLGLSNINRSQFSKMGERITSPINARIEDVEGNVNQIQADAQGLSVRISSAEESIDEVSGEVTSNTTNIATLTATAGGLTSQVESLTNVVGGEDAGLVYNVSQLQQTATGLTTSVQSINTTIGTDTTEGTLKYRIAQTELSASGVTTRVTSLEGSVGTNDTTEGTLRYRMSQMEQTAAGFVTTVAMSNAINNATGPLATDISNLSGDLDDLADEVAGFGSGYVSLSKATQTATGFSWTVRDASNNALMEFKNTGLTIHKGKLTIKNNTGTDVFYADGNGDLTLSGNILLQSTIGGVSYALEVATNLGLVLKKAGLRHGPSITYAEMYQSSYGVLAFHKNGSVITSIYPNPDDTRLFMDFNGGAFMSIGSPGLYIRAPHDPGNIQIDSWGGHLLLNASGQTSIAMSYSYGTIQLSAPNGIFANGIQIA